MLRSRFLLAAMTLVAGACSEPFAPTSEAPRSALTSSVKSSDFAILGLAAVTCTNGSVVGDIGTFEATPVGAITLTACPLVGSAHIGDGAAVSAYNAFLAEYAAMAPSSATNCTVLTGTLAGVTLAPGTYCFDAAAALTGTLTLAGSASSKWLFYVGTSGTGALTGTNFSVVLAQGVNPCAVTWWVAEAVTMTTSNFVGRILAGAAITMTGGTFAGTAYSQAGVTVTGTEFVGCTAPSSGNGNGGNNAGCNQGVGNGPEGCDPGNSNKRRPTNDEAGGIPGAPGRKGGA